VTIVLCLALAAGSLTSHAAERVDLIVRNGTIYDGSGNPPVSGGVAVRDGKVVAIGALPDFTAAREVDAKGLAIAPGFLTRLPAENFKLRQRGCFDTGCYADIVVFDPKTIADHATFEQPHQYATGVVHVFVNGVQVLKK